MKLLVFDIGSNSVRTLRVTQDAGFAPQFSGKRVFTTRLAEGLAETGALSKARTLQSLLVIRSLHSEHATQGFSSYAYATSAVRDAKNGQSFIDSVEEIIGSGHARILSGAEEAAFAQQGADPDGGKIILDIGGGSTQIVRPGSRESWPIGCVRAKDLAPYTELPAITDALYPILSGLFGPPKQDERTDRPVLSSERQLTQDSLLGVGGTITTLALLCEGKDAFAPWQGEKQIDLFALRAVLNALDAMGDAERAKIALLKDRHDVILHGGVILQYLLERLHSPRIGATLSDGLDGYALHLLKTLR
jgi:exopolyphosphatase / guanosine-5'-triphosphate,3'-diphosphate pyrophosphatase